MSDVNQHEPRTPDEAYRVLERVAQDQTSFSANASITAAIVARAFRVLERERLMHPEAALMSAYLLGRDEDLHSEAAAGGHLRSELHSPVAWANTNGYVSVELEIESRERIKAVISELTDGTPRAPMLLESFAVLLKREMISGEDAMLLAAMVGAGQFDAVADVMRRIDEGQAE